MRLIELRLELKPSHGSNQGRHNDKQQFKHEIKMEAVKDQNDLGMNKFFILVDIQKKGKNRNLDTIVERRFVGILVRWVFLEFCFLGFLGIWSRCWGGLYLDG